MLTCNHPQQNVLQGENTEDDIEKAALKQEDSCSCSDSAILWDLFKNLNICMQLELSSKNCCKQVLKKTLSRQLQESFISLTSAAKDGDADLVNRLRKSSNAMKGKPEWFTYLTLGSESSSAWSIYWRCELWWKDCFIDGIYYLPSRIPQIIQVSWVNYLKLLRSTKLSFVELSFVDLSTEIGTETRIFINYSRSELGKFWSRIGDEYFCASLVHDLLLFLMSLLRIISWIKLSSRIMWYTAVSTWIWCNFDY